jgi:hypothetical protein
MAIVSFGRMVHPMPELAITVILAIYQKYFKEIIPNLI